MGEEIAMFPCAHRFCKDCIQGMIKSPMYRNRSTFGCPVCRTRYNIHRDISYVRRSPQQAGNTAGEGSTAGPAQGLDGSEGGLITAVPAAAGQAGSTVQPEVRVVGSWGTKVEAIVQSLLHLRQQTPEAKSLVFSTWHEILNVIQEALDSNQVPCVHLKGRG
eukprot:TRINITY_DN31933_c0_g1_i1.p1 TRINITY_DN31933_c0_g1~~TRINITY_DN31933_c0_g1_i1.p1  ORF type:complete len:171 (-),score=15.62 TRINITY_DN31933_c0_g1_i1:16-501(-)